MRELKGSGSFLKRQVRKNLAKSIFYMLLFGAVFFVGILLLISNLRVDFLAESLVLASLAPLGASYYFQRRYGIYRGGFEGEKRVIKALRSTLNDDYFLINDISLHRGGDVDHVVIGPNGVFVIETKNWSGNIRNDGDRWQRQDQSKFKGNPSSQVKKNVNKIKQLLSLQPNLRNHGIWIQGIVVFTNQNAELSLNQPTVSVLRLSQLSNYILTYKNYNPYTTSQLQQISKEITKLAIQNRES